MGQEADVRFISMQGFSVRKDPTSDYAKINDELLPLLDPDRNAGTSRILLKSVVDATIIDMPAA